MGDEDQGLALRHRVDRDSRVQGGGPLPVARRLRAPRLVAVVRPERHPRRALAEAGAPVAPG